MNDDLPGDIPPSEKASTHNGEQPIPANRERPTPDLPRLFTFGYGEENQLRTADQVLRRNIADRGEHTAVGTEALNLPAIVWQIPVGNTSLADTTDKWRDNRLDYLFGHMNEVAAAHVVALFFGAGASGMTTPETDGGNFIAKMTAYRNAGGTRLCP
jgi:hypothetical protein